MRLITDNPSSEQLILLCRMCCPSLCGSNFRSGVAPLSSRCKEEVPMAPRFSGFGTFLEIRSPEWKLAMHPSGCGIRVRF